MGTRLLCAVTIVTGLTFGVVGPASGSAARGVAASVCNTIGAQGVGNGPGAVVSVQFSSPTHGWAAGADRVLRTVDGGTRWSSSFRHAGAAFFQVDAYDDRDVWVLGNGGIARTTDGGRDWTWVTGHCPGISTIDFYSPRAGLAVAGAQLLRTADGGRSWTRLPAPRKPQSACLADGKHGWAGANGQIYRTVDGGLHWRLAVAAPRQDRTRELTTAPVECAGPRAGWAELDFGDAAMNQSQHVGYHLAATGSRPIFAEGYFSSGELRKLPSAPGPEPATFSAIGPRDAAYVDFCGPCGYGASVVAIVTDGHRVGHSYRVHGLNGARGAAFLSTTEGWVVGQTRVATRHPDWAIVHTTDGGRTWTTQYES